MPQRQNSLQDGLSPSEDAKETEEGKDADEPPRDPQVMSADLAETPRSDFNTETEEACTTLRAILNANIGACYVKLVSQFLPDEMFHVN